MYKTFGSRLVHAMELRNMRQKELAKETGVTEATVSRYVNEKRRPDIDFIRDVVRVLNVSADYLLGFSDQMTLGSPSNHYRQASGAKYTVVSRDDVKAVAVVDPDQIASLDKFFESLDKTFEQNAARMNEGKDS